MGANPKIAAVKIEGDAYDIGAQMARVLASSMAKSPKFGPKDLLMLASGFSVEIAEIGGAAIAAGKDGCPNCEKINFLSTILGALDGVATTLMNEDADKAEGRPH